MSDINKVMESFKIAGRYKTEEFVAKFSSLIDNCNLGTVTQSLFSSSESDYELCTFGDNTFLVVRTSKEACIPFLVTGIENFEEFKVLSSAMKHENTGVLKRLSIMIADFLKEELAKSPALPVDDTVSLLGTLYSPFYPKELIFNLFNDLGTVLFSARCFNSYIAFKDFADLSSKNGIPVQSSVSNCEQWILVNLCIKALSFVNTTDTKSELTVFYNEVHKLYCNAVNIKSACDEDKAFSALCTMYNGLFTALKPRVPAKEPTSTDKYSMPKPEPPKDMFSDIIKSFFSGDRKPGVVTVIKNPIMGKPNEEELEGIFPKILSSNVGETGVIKIMLDNDTLDKPVSELKNLVTVEVLPNRVPAKDIINIYSSVTKVGKMLLCTKDGNEAELLTPVSDTEYAIIKK